MTGFTKLFSSIVDSTIWREEKHIKVVWVTMLAKADKNGFVGMSLPGLADAARVTIPECEEALALFYGPDKYSRSKDFEGRRIMDADGGWILLNYSKYRKIRDEDERRIQVANNVRAFRERKAKDKDVINTVTNVTSVIPSKPIAEAEAEAEAKRKETSLRSEKKADTKPGKPQKPSRTAGLLAAKFSDRAVDLATIIIDDITPKADPEKDADGKQRPIRTDMALLVQRLEEIMNSDPAWTEDVLIRAYQGYLKGKTKNIKAPQYFFSTVPDKYSTTDEPVWKPYAKGVLYKDSRQRPLLSLETTPAPLCPPITETDAPGHDSAAPWGQDEHD